MCSCIEDASKVLGRCNQQLMWVQMIVRDWAEYQEHTNAKALQDLVDEFAEVEVASLCGLRVAFHCCDPIDGFANVNAPSLRRLLVDGERLAMRPGCDRADFCFNARSIRSIVRGDYDPATREACARLCLACCGMPSLAFEVGNWARLRQALRPYEMIIKRRACVSLDMPGVGQRFLREHGPILDLL